ncbi:hypothetical protein ACVXZ4_04045 [Lacisediminihabitans sp. FW035]
MTVKEDTTNPATTRDQIRQLEIGILRDELLAEISDEPERLIRKSNTLRAARDHGVTLAMLAEWVDRHTAASQIYPFFHSATARVVDRVPRGYVTRSALARELGVGRSIIDHRITNGEITDEILRRSDSASFVRITK